MIGTFKSITELEKAFPDETACVTYFRDMRWPEGVKCVHCDATKVYTLKNLTFKCGACAKKFTVRNGTIFEDSKLPLTMWFRAIFLMISNPKGVSSMEIHRQLGVTQKTAWFVVQRIRELTIAMGKKPIMAGTVQVDEMYVGGKEKWKHANKKSEGAQGYGSYKTKTGVIGLIEKGGELRIEKIRSGGAQTIKKHVLRNVELGSTVHTDEAVSYRWMSNHFAHESINHRLGEYVRGDVTTNDLEGAFGHFKRSVTGVYHQVSDEHLNRYLAAFAWRWNRKQFTTGERTEALVKACAGRRLTYARLTRKVA
jgi:transposase-like protein